MIVRDNKKHCNSNKEMIQDLLNFINNDCVIPNFVEKERNNKAKVGDAIREVEFFDL